MSKLAARKVRATAYSACIAQAAVGTPQRGSVHSVFAAAANILFPGEFVLSLNASSSPQMPNGLRLSASEGQFPFSVLRPGMPILLGASRLHIEALDCSLDLTTCPQWNPHIDHPPTLNIQTLKENRARLHTIWEGHTSRAHLPGRAPSPGRPQADSPGDCQSALLYTPPSATPSTNPVCSQSEQTNVYSRATPCGWPGGCGRAAGADGGYAVYDITQLARSLCGRGMGLTPTGDDMLAGWMAMGWLLYGPEPAFLAVCKQIMEVARKQTHLLSRCWLGYAARGNVALPIVRLLEALAREPGTENNTQLELAAQAVLAMGATSGYDVISGLLLGLEQFFLT